MIGRDEELMSISAFLESVQDGPQALVVAGEAGIGKTSLWHAGVDVAGQRFPHVLTCRGVEAEATLSFAALSELMTPVLEEASSSLLAPRRRALEIALLIADPDDGSPDAHAVGLAVLDVLRVLAADGSLLVAVDDAQWLDAASAGALQLALRRLRDEPVGLLATVRATAGSGSQTAFDGLFPEDRSVRLSLDPLTAAAVHKLLKDRLGLELTRPELRRVSDATAGNPFFALELGRELIRLGTRPSPGVTLRIPASLRELLGGRLARLPAETTNVLLLVAATPRPTLDLVAAADGDRERTATALEAAAHEGVIEFDDARLRFRHPMLASICYEDASIWRRHAAHRALAGAVSDREERARHLALAAEGPDAGIAAELDEAAELAAARGATTAAADLVGLAIHLTANDPLATRRRQLRAAQLHHLAGDSERAIRLLEQLRVDAPPGVERADALFALARTLKRDASAMIELCEEALREAWSDDARSARILAFLTWPYVFVGDVQSALARGREALERAERVGDPGLLAMVIGRAGHAEVWAAEVTPGLLERGAELEAGLGRPLDYLESPRVPLGRLLMRRGQLDRARLIFSELDAEMSARGDEGSRVETLWTLSMLEWLAGRFQRALELAAAGGELAEQIQYGHGAGWIGRVRALIETDLGRADEARHSATQCLAFARAESNELYANFAEAALGRLELVLGDLAAAANHLRELPRRLIAGGLNDPTAPIWADAIETLIRLGEVELAALYLEYYEANAERLASPPAIAGAARCRGLLAAAAGDLPGAIAAYERSLAELERVSLPLELARTLLCLGSARRRGRQSAAARDALDHALAIFDDLGARPWAEKARAELRRISGRRPAGEELTPTETRVAALAAEGQSNREIAAALFMGRSTVEMHLSRVYRKLGIRSRTQLALTFAPGSSAGKTKEEAAKP